MRRNLLWLGGIALAYGALASGPNLWRRVFPAAFDFSEIPGLPGFRRIGQGAVSAGSPVLIGLDAGAPAPPRAAPGELRADLCAHLFGGAIGTGAVPVAYFSDVRCSYCRVLTPLVHERSSGAAASIRLAWHELPLLGESSVLAARAALAAGFQGAGPAIHARLAATRLVPTQAALVRLAEDIGIDGARLVADMAAPRVDRQLAVSLGLAGLFGFPGTPALVVGRTAVLGRIEAGDLDRLIALEAAEAATAPCA
ncbi:DSBA-like thioredoxin domain-containing protein [Rhodovulum euryhalinum]|uniref:DSBA-like thioredoxin domain-containing protein n=2 Tax=Rhodovulum euryhalinum TaxID=35805 RepID=A0A4R2L507_9RHOB|nr:DSBA-like thioredoxin domain-containing protein [Rhodovulum euryhalinum]